jgi:hypothetical protein
MMMSSFKKLDAIPSVCHIYQKAVSKASIKNLLHSAENLCVAVSEPQNSSQSV